MKKFISMFLRHWRKSPVKISLTVLSVALGTGILIISFSAGSIIKDRVTDGMAQNGTVLYVANASINSDGSQERVMPSEWDAEAPAKVLAESGAVAAAAIIADVNFDEIAVNGTSYRLRSSVGTSPEYFDVFMLDIIAGVPMQATDVSSSSKKAWISEQLATTLFGSAEAAIGQQVQPPGMTFRRGAGEGENRTVITNYSITGVFSNPTEVARRSYGIADLVFPYTSMLPAGMNVTFQLRMMAGTFVVRTSIASEKKAEAAIRAVLSAAYADEGEDVSVLMWEGSARGASTYLEQLRQAISIFTVSVNILGLVLLVISSLGIFSVMVVELLGRRREIALERAIGASQMAVVKEFWTWSLALSLFGAVLGILIAIPLSGPVLKTIAPLVGEVSDQFRSAAGIDPMAVVYGLLLALGCGGILGALPAFSAVKGNIANTLREE